MPCRRLADDLEAARQRLGLGRWVAAGDSGGAAVALLYALRYPQALAGLILEFCYASLAPALADPDSRFSPLHPENQVAIASIAPPRVPGHTLQWVQLPDARWLGWHENTPWGIWPFEMSDRIQALMEELRFFDVRDRLAEIQLPTLIVAGRHDDLIPLRHSQLVADRIADAQLVVLEHSGHAVAEEDQEHYRQTVQAFITQRVRARS
jgi:proline iminopeptidase